MFINVFQDPRPHNMYCTVKQPMMYQFKIHKYFLKGNVHKFYINYSIVHATRFFTYI